ncbi:Deoxyuridine 5'-triphosphate nucleotidohydrolase,deoxyuridine 5'-triphosphate nucleotidohydrolase,dUTP diphosphatase,dUTPase [Chlamydia serpentis]|uniref:Deoxyuridine 5'-triphosphate nucleotidohydrolase n=1 Tax=Chlamydia serpentis TaxID=1967782 RepID=A0A2R8F9Y0_9CHLA|nr:dUTP diphosphatase [Chlamydia serpentis]SPN73230.1 Deoxyuridine 5'-triphosphate nucleotidohydrolase,deoxyuridine 5'-triphosphate nucleotidohydrolase,dUTP diphosphatase,dUTPase [Chlamydia serpentis]
MNVFCELDLGGEIPQYATAGAAGADLRANIKEPLALFPGQRVLVPTGIRAEIPIGYELQVRPRSGLALKHGVTVLNAPGTIDSDYRGEIGVILINFGDTAFIIEPKMRIAQIVLSPVVRAEFVVKQGSLAETGRGSGGFGHTGAN